MPRERRERRFRAVATTREACSLEQLLEEFGMGEDDGIDGRHGGKRKVSFRDEEERWDMLECKKIYTRQRIRRYTSAESEEKVSGTAGFLRQEADGATDVFCVVSAWVYVRGRELQLYKISSTELALN